MSSSPLNIAIIGAGPSGLTLARLLSQLPSPIPNYTIFELDASPSARFYQGGSLDLHTHTGLAAIKKCNLWDSFRRYARYDGEALIIADKQGKAIFRKSGNEDGENIFERPEIDRERLKEILLESVPAERVKWGRKLKEVTEDWKLKFESGAEEGPFDLIVGCDGAWSKVRARLTDVKPQYSGISGLQFTLAPLTPTASDEAKAADKLVGRGSHFCYGDNKSLGAQRQGNGGALVGAYCRTEAGWAPGFVERYGGTGNGEKIKQALIDEKFADWAPELQAWINVADPTRIRAWTLHELPVGHTWTHHRGVTLIGDAAHLATPFAGEGVNAAMADALDLAEAIGSSDTTTDALDAAIAKFESEKMWPRASSVQHRTVQNKDGMFAADAPAKWMEKMRRRFWAEIEKIEDPAEREKAKKKMEEIEEKSKRGDYE